MSTNLVAFQSLFEKFRPASKRSLTAPPGQGEVGLLGRPLGTEVFVAFWTGDAGFRTILVVWSILAEHVGH